MTKTNMNLTELLQKHDQGDLLRSIAEAVLQLMMESDVDGLIGAGRHERAEQRTTWRNGYRDRSLDTRLGTLNLKVPKLRQAAISPAFSKPARPRNRRWWPSFRRRGLVAYLPAASTNWCRPWG